MQVGVNKEITTLRCMAASQLRQRHLELFGEESQPSNRQWLFRRLVWRVQSLAEGDLSERSYKRTRELAQEVDIRVRPPKELTMPLATGTPLTLGQIPIRRDDRLPMPGAVLTRVFKRHEETHKLIRYYLKITYETSDF